MSTDLLFSILPRLGKVPIRRDGYKVQKVTKNSRLRAVESESDASVREKALPSTAQGQPEVKEDDKQTKGKLDVFA